MRGIDESKKVDEVLLQEFLRAAPITAKLLKEVAVLTKDISRSVASAGNVAVPNSAGGMISVRTIELRVSHCSSEWSEHSLRDAARLVGELVEVSSKAVMDKVTARYKELEPWRKEGGSLDRSMVRLIVEQLPTLLLVDGKLHVACIMEPMVPRE